MPSTKVNREKFLHQLESVQPGVSSREILEQSSCLIFKDGRVTSFNDEVSCSSPSSLPKSITGAVRSEPLLAIVQKLGEEEIEVSCTTEELLITGKRKQIGCRLEAEIVLPIDVVEKPEKWIKLHEDFADAVAIVEKCAAKDESQKTGFVHIHPKWLEACDYFQLARWPMVMGIKKAFLVRQSSIRHVASLGMTDFAETESWVHFRNAGGLIFSCRRHAEEAARPDCYRLFPPHAHGNLRVGCVTVD